MIELWFLFSLIWSICASVDEDSRKKMDNFLREIEGQFPAKVNKKYSRPISSGMRPQYPSFGVAFFVETSEIAEAQLLTACLSFYLLRSETAWKRLLRRLNWWP